MHLSGYLCCCGDTNGTASHAWASRDQSAELPKSSGWTSSGLSQRCMGKVRGSSHALQQGKFCVGVRNTLHRRVVELSPALEATPL